MNGLRALQEYGQAVWLDYIRRGFITSGELQSLVEEDGLSGVTANPTIFEKAIAGGADYDEPLQDLLRQHTDMGAEALYEALAVADIQMAADALRPVYDRTWGADGYVSLELSPLVANDTGKTITEAHRLWKALGRPNVMLKVPATAAGIPAIERLIGEGLNINITLIFSLENYEEVARAYIRGLEKWMSSGGDPKRVASVASFFVSRVDTAVDKALEAISSAEALSLRGRAAVANAKLAYERFKALFCGEDFAPLRDKGARVQRTLWASTSTKNPGYPELMYVEELVGPDTVNTLPLSTLHGARERLKPRASLGEGVEAAHKVFELLQLVGVDLAAVTQRLQDEGVAAFAASYQKILEVLRNRRQAVLEGYVSPQRMALGPLEPAYQARLQSWEEQRFCQRLWRKDTILWSRTLVPELADRLGWLTLPESMSESIEELVSFAREVREAGYHHAVLLGMGGASLAAEVFQATFGSVQGAPELLVLDSTHPQAIKDVERRVQLDRTLFFVTSKSGTTLETMALFHYFWERIPSEGNRGSQFVGITDPGTSLDRVGQERRFRRVWLAPPDVGGRYSALSVFGLLPAALIGVDIGRVLERALVMVEACASCVPMSKNACLQLGAVLGELTLAGRDKVTLVTSPSIASWGAWLEQLLAESTGKNGKGIIPVIGEPLGPTQVYGDDRVFMSLSLASDEGPGNALDALERAGHPVVRISLEEKADLGQEFFRWEMATAAAGAVLGINPFDQPDVQLAKDLASEWMGRYASGAALPEMPSVHVANGDAAERLGDWLKRARPGDYLAVQAYLAPTPESGSLLGAVRTLVRDRLRIATTVGFGPRFLHSTGQLHKGGPNSGLFLQIVDEPEEDFPVPGESYTFGMLLRAQALADYQALEQRGRRVLRLNLGRNAEQGIKGLLATLDQAVPH